MSDYYRHLLIVFFPTTSPEWVISSIREVILSFKKTKSSLNLFRSLEEMTNAVMTSSIMDFEVKAAILDMVLQEGISPKEVAVTFQDQEAATAEISAVGMDQEVISSNHSTISNMA